MVLYQHKLLKRITKPHLLLDKSKWITYENFKNAQKTPIDPTPEKIKQKSTYDKDRYKKIKAGTWQPKKKK